MKWSSCLAVSLLLSTPDADGVALRHVLTGEALSVTPPDGTQPALPVLEFLKTGVNPHDGNAQSVEAGKRLYMDYCSSCHMPQAQGRFGPNLVDNIYLYQQVKTEAGMFAVILGGAAGAMRGFGDRLSADEILCIMAHLASLKR